MTEAEAPAHIERLKRIWVPKQETVCELKFVHAGHYGQEGYIAGKIELEDRVHIEFNPESWKLELLDEQNIVLNYLAYLPGPSKILRITALMRQRQPNQSETFFAQWRPLFRRNCWLSGAPIEATAHEKIEWIQGFTQQEIQAWNLTF